MIRNEWIPKKFRGGFNLRISKEELVQMVQSLGMSAPIKSDKVVLDGPTSTWDRYEYTWIETLKLLMKVINLTSRLPSQS